jgi:hypothetical protein
MTEITVSAQKILNSMKLCIILLLHATVESDGLTNYDDNDSETDTEYDDHQDDP